MNPLIRPRKATPAFLARECFRFSRARKSRAVARSFSVPFIADLLPALVRSKMAAVLTSILCAVSARNACAQFKVVTFDDKRSLGNVFYLGGNGMRYTGAR